MSGKPPISMTCVEIAEFGGPEVLKPATRPTPEVAAGEILVRVAAAGVNRPDIFQRQGNYPPPRGVTHILGLEVAGVVAAVADDIAGWKAGDSLCALTSGGGYAEYCAVPAPQCLPIPDGLNMIEAAAVPETFFTVWTNIFERAALKPGETFLVHGGAGGIGTAAIQMANRLGARIIATAGTAEKCALCMELGAERAINYRQEDFVDVAKEFGNGKGVDVILDMVGGGYIERNIKALAADGRLVNIAYLQGSKAEINFLPVMLKRLTITGSTPRPQTVERKGAIAGALQERIWPLIAADGIKPVINATFPLAEAADAHRLMESGNHFGKIVLVV